MGILIAFSSSVLPLVKLNQTLIKTGPSITLTESNQYWIDTFILPTIDNDTPVIVNLKGEKAGGLGITIIPYKNGAYVIGKGAILNHIFNVGEQIFAATARTSVESEYFVSVSCIRNNYTLTISSVWSPYDSLKAYLYLGLSAFPAGLLIIYYDRIIEKRDRLFQKAMTE